MVRGAGAGLLAILCWGGAAAQSGFRVENVPAGRVTDTAGNPIRGARVLIRVESTGPQFRRARDQILRKQRLPVVFTSRDGSFVLPFTRAQRLLSTPIDGHFSLVVEKAGYQTWVEPMGGGVSGYLGSEVKLRRLGPEDRFEVRVQQPVPGMKLLVRRRASPGLGNQPHVDMTRVVDVPADGIVKVVMPLVPSPCVITGNYNYLPLIRDVQVLYPGRSSAAVPVPHGQRVVEIPAVTHERGPSAEVVAHDTKPLEAVRALFFCPDQQHRWFSLPDGTLPSAAILRPRAVTARGCVVQNPVRISRGRVVLERAPVPDGPRQLRVVDQAGKPIRGAMVGCYAMDSLRDPNDPFYGPGTAWRVRRTGVDGVVQVPDVVDRVPTVLMVQAPGYRRAQVPQPRNIVGTRDVRLVASSHGSLELTLTTGDGAPLAGAYLRFPDRFYELGAILDRIPRTDESGTIRLDHLPPGKVSALVVGDDVIHKLVNVQVTHLTVQRHQEVVEAAPLLRGVTVTDDGEPVPFAPIQPYINHRLRSIRVPAQMVSDSQGRFVLRGVPDQAVGVSVRPLQQESRWVNQPMDRDGGVSKVPVTSAALLLVKMPPENPVHKAVTYVMNQRRRVVTLSRNEPAVATLVRWSGEDNVSLFFRLAKGPPLRIDNDVLASARAPGTAPEILVLGEQPVRRRVPVLLDGEHDQGLGLEGDRLRLEISNVGGSRPYVYEDLGLGVTRDKDGKWWFLARDDGAYRGRLLHPQLRPLEFEVPQKTRPTGDKPTGDKPTGDKPIKVTLQRGVPLAFEIHLDGQRLNDTNNLNVRLRDQARRTYVLYWHQPLGSVDYKVGDDKVMRLRCPVGLEPGKYTVHLRIHGTRISLNTDITVTKDQERVALRFKDGKATVVGPEVLDRPSAPDKR